MPSQLKILILILNMENSSVSLEMLVLVKAHYLTL